jgi:hypothetical protein
MLPDVYVRHPRATGMTAQAESVLELLYIAVETRLSLTPVCQIRDGIGEYRNIILRMAEEDITVVAQNPPNRTRRMVVINHGPSRNLMTNRAHISLCREQCCVLCFRDAVAVLHFVILLTGTAVCLKPIKRGALLVVLRESLTLEASLTFLHRRPWRSHPCLTLLRRSPTSGRLTLRDPAVSSRYTFRLAAWLGIVP